MFSTCVNWIDKCTLYAGQLSGDALQGSLSPLNDIRHQRSLSLLIQIPYSLQLVPVTRIEFWRNEQGFWKWINKLQMGWLILPGQFYVDMDIARSIRKFFPLVDSTTVTRPWVGLRWKRVESDPDGSDRTCPKCRTRVLATPRITGQSEQCRLVRP